MMYWIDSQNCKACLKCVDACPVPGALIVRRERPIIDAAYCTDCGACAAACPHNAIAPVEAATPEIIQSQPASNPVTTIQQQPPVQTSQGGQIAQRKDAGVPAAKEQKSNLPARKQQAEDQLAESRREQRTDLIRTIAEVGGALVSGIVSSLASGGSLTGGRGSGQTGIGKSGSSNRRGGGMGRGGGRGQGLGSGRGSGRGRQRRNRNQ